MRDDSFQFLKQLVEAPSPSGFEEPVQKIIKQVMGYRQTLLRGFEKVSGDWGLVCLAYNFKRLFSLQTV